MYQYAVSNDEVPPNGREVGDPVRFVADYGRTLSAAALRLCEEAGRLARVGS